MSSSAPAVHRFASFDGAEIAFRTLGAGAPALMLHGFLASAQLNWFEPGIAQAVADAGFQVIAPDLRGHGDSAAPTEADAYPPDVLARDQEALLGHLSVTDYVLAGYSLGARTAVRLMVRNAQGKSAQPRRAALGGMGDSGVLAAGARAAMFEDSIRHGEHARDPRSGRYIQAVMRQRGLKPEAMLGVLASFVPTTVDDLSRIAVPTLVVCGERDQDNGSAEALARLLADAHALSVPGDHLTAVIEPRLARAFADHLAGRVSGPGTAAA